ncbi:hypothetical protein BR93DRAFT_940463 [Coniochaeta sp. PMI_546]|nr:hypothetical protein BR93DRAFT_940463 [Coniochaeta sp. PMI_546]
MSCEETSVFMLSSHKVIRASELQVIHQCRIEVLPHQQACSARSVMIWICRCLNQPPLNVLGYNKNGGKILVFQAWNAGDDAASRIPLRGILLSVWKTEAGGDVKSLKYIQYENVDEASVLQAIDDAYKAMGKTPKETKVLAVGVTGTAPGEQAAFQKLATGNPFGVGAQKMIEDYAEMAGRQSTALIVNLS